MAKFLDTQAMSHELMRLIKDAKEKIIFVSYSLKVNPQIQERVKTKSKMGTLSEIVIVYGKTELKQPDIEWMKEVQDLKIYEKLNLHAKCYLNEERAIIGSMNLYEYSQQNNIEMGILITKSQDPEAYSELMDEINNIKINGTRKFPKDFEHGAVATAVKMRIEKPLVKAELTNAQKASIALLNKLRDVKSKLEKTNATQILTDDQMRAIAMLDHPDKAAITAIIDSRNANRYGAEILDFLDQAKSLTIGKVTSVFYQQDESKYDRVKLKVLSSGEERWYETIKELPEKDSIVGVRINANWFNEYFYL